MYRRQITPRQDWVSIVEAQGFHFHTPDGQKYWDESAYYSFSEYEIDRLEQATQELDQMCLAAVQHVIDQNLLDVFSIPPHVHQWVRDSWEQDELTVYGRFDLAFTSNGSPKLLEFNADTPTALLEAAVIQWQWLKDTQPNGDQFNSIHERLIEAWGQARSAVNNNPIYFSALGDHLEDYMTVNYLRDTAIQAKLATEFIAVEDISWNDRLRQFFDPSGNPIFQIFKLYPWEWMLEEEFGSYLPASPTKWLEAPWKMILSNKAILAVLWDLYPNHPYLLRAEYEPFGPTYVQKPIHSREGSNVSIVIDGQPMYETDGPYEGAVIYQEYCPLPEFDGKFPIVGSWLVNGHACGIGIREDDQPITQNTSRFIPHAIE